MATQFVFGHAGADVPAVFSQNCKSETVVATGTAASTTETSDPAHNACRVATDAAVYVSFGTAPNASTDASRFMLPAGAVDTFRIGSGGNIIASVVTV